jgi:hypothetical protein
MIVRGVTVAVIVLLLIAVLVLLWDPITRAFSVSEPAVVTIMQQAPPAERIAIEDLPIPLEQVGANAEGSSDLAVQAEPLAATVVYTETGEVVGETMTPSGTARGVVTLFNPNAQAIDLPQGTEFVATNPAGNEVIFTSDAAVVLPGANTSDTGAQVITTRGQAQVEISARQPGSAGNVDAGTIIQIRPPGQAAINANSGFLLWEHGPLTGGTEEPIRVVKDTDVQALLSPALTGLNNRARQVLEQMAGDSGLVLETSTIMPRADELSQGEGYTVTVIPPVGQTVDPANPFFEVVVEGRFNALATPPGASLAEQVQVVAPNQLAQNDDIPAGTGLVDVSAIWDGSRLTVDGVLAPTGEALPLAPEQRAAIVQSISGRPRAEAIAALNSFVQQGVISGYELPPDLNVLPETIQLQQVPPGGLPPDAGGPE